MDTLWIEEGQMITNNTEPEPTFSYLVELSRGLYSETIWLENYTAIRLDRFTQRKLKQGFHVQKKAIAKAKKTVEQQ